MRQGNMVGKFKVDIGTVYDNFGTSPKFWALISYKMDHFFLFWLRYILLIFLVMEHLFLIFFPGLETSTAGVMPQTWIEMCDFSIWGICVNFGIFSGDATAVFENRDHSGKL